MKRAEWENFLFHEEKLNKSQSLLSGKCLASHYHHRQTAREGEWLSAFALCKYINKNIFLPSAVRVWKLCKGLLMIERRHTLARQGGQKSNVGIERHFIKRISRNPSSTSSSFECHHFQFSNPPHFSRAHKSFPCEKLPLTPRLIRDVREGCRFSGLYK